MNYINFKILDKFLKEFKIEDLFYILAVKQQDQENIEEYYNLNTNQKLLDLKYLKQLKNGELRLDKKGTEFLRDLGKSDTVSEDNKKIVEWFVKSYKERGGFVKNKTECLRRCEWFSNQTGFFQNQLAILISLFTLDTYNQDSGLTVQEFMKENPRGVLSQLIDNLFYSPPNHFAKNYSLDHSPLWTYYENNKEYVEQVWREKGIEI